MATKHNVSATWKTPSSIKINVAGAWKTLSNIKINVAGTWKQVHGCTLTTASLVATNVSHSTDITCYAQTRYGSNGTEYSNSSGLNNYSVSRGAWLDAGDACGGWIDHTLNSGSALYQRAQVPGTRAQMTANRDYRQRDINSSAGSVTSNITVKMYNAQTGGTLKSSATYSLTANYFDACPTCCFTPDTPIMMSDGLEIPIGQIREGDEIVTYDYEKGAFKTEVVEEVIVRFERPMYKVYFEDGTVLHVSDDHPLDVKGKPKSVTPQDAYKHMWKSDELKLGDRVTCIKSQWWQFDCAAVTKIEYSEYKQAVFTLGNTYFFANGKLVY